MFFAKILSKRRSQDETSRKNLFLPQKAGLSQEGLAEKIGVSRQAISKWETGEATPELNKLPLLTKTFGVTYDWLLTDSDEEIQNIVYDNTEKSNIKNENQRLINIFLKSTLIAISIALTAIGLALLFISFYGMTLFTLPWFLVIAAGILCLCGAAAIIRHLIKHRNKREN